MKILFILVALLAIICGALVAKIANLEGALMELATIVKDHNAEASEVLTAAERWKASANYRFDDDEKDIAKLKEQMTRLRAYVYRYYPEEENAEQSL